MKKKNNNNIKSLLKKYDFFDKIHYLRVNHDARLADLTAIDHFLSVGLQENRQPNAEFDPEWYLLNYPDVASDGAQAVIHFLLHGIHEGRLKNSNEKEQYDQFVEKGDFDHVFYREHYDDLSSLEEKFDLITHFVRHGQHEGRIYKRVISQVEAVNLEPNIKYSSEDELLVKDSGLFNIFYYLNSYQDIKSSGQDPIEHFCNYGWKENRNPNEDFSTDYYKEKYPDIAESGMNPFVHWLSYGRNEGRFINYLEVNPHNEEVAQCPSIIFISHEASQTGAPAVLLSLMNWVKENTCINFSIIVGAHGPWNAKFEAIAPVFYMDNGDADFDNSLKIFCGNHVQAIYINTIASALYADKLNFLHADVITHVHEMENVFKIFEPHVEVLKNICNKYIAVSQGSLDAINKRFDVNNIDVRFLKPFIDKKVVHENLPVKPDTKKSIFGCGAVEMRKGFDLFCIVASELKRRGCQDFCFYWIGSDENKDLIASEVIALHDVGDAVKFLGTKDYPRDYFGWGDVFLLPSREDPYPLVCMEAAECDMPVICFDEQAGGMHTFVEQDAGMVVSYLDTNAMADAVQNILEDEPLRLTLGTRAHQKVVERHYVDVIAPKILEFLPDTIKINAHAHGQDPYINYTQLIDQCDVISFDIFDTLVTRQLADPNVVFDVLEYRHTENESAPVPLFQERMQTAGKVLGSYNGKRDDISIDEIYQNMAFYKNSELEKQTEIEMCVSHPLGKKIYDYAKAQGKVVCITSDMYLDTLTVQSILRKNGINDWDYFYLSSEEGKKKDTGKLFELLKTDMLKQKIMPEKILHIGDNWKGDIQYARQAGLHAVRFTPIYEKPYKLIDLSSTQKTNLSQIGRIWESYTTQATRLWHESNPELAQDTFIKLGFELTGPLAIMMAMHTKQLAEKTATKKIIFMARDGRIIKKAFDYLYAEQLKKGAFESSYLHLSRATIVPATFENPLSTNDIYFLIEGLHLAQKSVRYFLEKANLNPEDKPIQKVAKVYFKSLDVVPNWEDLNKLSSMFEALSERVYEANTSNRDALADYLIQSECLQDEKILVVDVGWLLNIQSRLDRFAKLLGSSTTIIGSYVGSRERINKNIHHESLLYDGGDPAYYSRFLEDNVTLFELLFSSPEPSAKGLVNNAGLTEVDFKPIQKPTPDQEFLVAQKLHMGAEGFFKYFKGAMQSYFPEQISKDYFFESFKCLVETENDHLKATLNSLEIRLGGQHEFVLTQQLLGNSSNIELRIKPHDEYFEPIRFFAENEQQHITIVTSAGLDNGSTRYRAIHLAEALKNQHISTTLIHAATPTTQAEAILQNSQKIIFQRCFEEQGNVGNFFNFAHKMSIKTLYEMDDLIVPEYISEIGSVKGGEWGYDDAMFVALSYEKLMKKVDACIVSTPLLKEYIEKNFNIPSVIFRNKVTPKRLKEPTPIDPDNIKLIYASGTYSHKQDFDFIEAILYDFLKSHQQVSLSVLGAAQVSERLLALENVKNYPILPYTAMLNFIAEHDLMLVPLVDDVFNQAKSNVKFAECGAVGVPVLASKVGEFDLAMESQKNGLLACTAEEFKAILDEISNEPMTIERLATEAYNTINENYTTAFLEEAVIEMVRGL